MELSRNSWMVECIRKYKKILRDGTIEDLDKANEVVCQSILKFDKIIKRRKIEIERLKRR